MYIDRYVIGDTGSKSVYCTASSDWMTKNRNAINRKDDCGCDWSEF